MTAFYGRNPVVFFITLENIYNQFYYTFILYSSGICMEYLQYELIISQSFFTHLFPLNEYILWIKLQVTVILFFQVEVTKYEELEEVHAELKLKQLLWDSIEDWDKTTNEWMEVR